MKSQHERSKKHHKKNKRIKSHSPSSQEQGSYAHKNKKQSKINKRRRSSFSQSDSSSNHNIKMHKKDHRRHQNSHSKQLHRRKYQSQQKSQQQEKIVRHKYQSKYEKKLQAQPKQQTQQEKIEKQLPCFQPSGILLEYYNSRQGVKLKFTQPQDAAIPLQQWRIYPFKGQQTFSIFSNNLDPILLRQSCYLVGKDERICDILCENPSISRQHAVIQFRLIHKMDVSGNYSQSVHPYVMDLQSTNGTFINDQKIQPTRYVQLLDRDIIKFGLSQRQYVIVKQDNQQQNQQVV